MDPCFSKLLHFMKSINDANMMEQNESRGDGCHLPYFGCSASESLSRCGEDSTLRVSVEIRAHGSPLTLETLASQSPSSAELRHLICVWPIRYTALAWTRDHRGSASKSLFLCGWQQQLWLLCPDSRVSAAAGSSSRPQSWLWHKLPRVLRPGQDSRQLLCHTSGRALGCCPASFVVIPALSLALWPSQRFCGLPSMLSVNSSCA